MSKNSSWGSRAKESRRFTSLVIVLLVCAVASARGQQPISFQYFYDDTNQLTKVIDSNGNIVQYVYDALGNILQINRSTSSPGVLSIFNVTPLTIAAGGTLTIQGQGFSATLAANRVLIGGVAATVISATATTLVVLVPANAVSGTISVSVGGNSVISTNPETVVQLPIITSVSPKAALSGSTVSQFQVTGSNLTSASFAFPPGIMIVSSTISPSGTSAILSLVIGANAFGRYTIVATSGVGNSSGIPVYGVNSLSVPGQPGGDPDGDGIANAYELLLGTDPLAPDTDGDSFSDGVEVASGSNPLDPKSTPLNSRLSGENEGLTFSALNSVLTTRLFAESETKPFSVLDQQGSSLTSSVERESVPFSALVGVMPATLLFEADAVPFSLCNAVGPCSDYAPLSRPTPSQNGAPVTISQRPGQNANAASRRPFSILAATLRAQSAKAEGNSLITIAFSAPLDPGGIRADNFVLSVAGIPVSYTLRYSADFRMVMLAASLPPDAVVQLSVSGNVRDLSGDRLAGFENVLHTARSQGIASAVLQQEPPNGANGIDPNTVIRLTLRTRADFNALQDGLRVTQDGGPVPGAIRLSATGREVEFTPDKPLAPSAVIQISLQDIHNSSEAYEGVFTTASGAEALAAEPTRTMPGSASGVALNAVFDTEFDGSLRAAALPEGSVRLTDISGQLPVPVQFFKRDDRVVRVIPSSPLRPETNYELDLLNPSNPAVNPVRYFFATGVAPLFGPPQLTSVSPQPESGVQDTRVEVHLRFDRAMNPLSFNGNTVVVTADNAPIPVSISFSADGQEVLLTPLAALSAATEALVTLSGVEDVSGNVMPYLTVPFRIGAEPARIADLQPSPGRSRSVFGRRLMRFLIRRR